MFDRKEHWESIYHDKSPREVSWYQRDPGLSLQLIRNTRLSLDEPMIDVGGGASVLVDCLCQEGFTRVAVLDIVQYDAEKLLTELAAGFELAEEKTEVHITPAQREQKLAWFRLVRKPATPAPSG